MFAKELFFVLSSLCLLHYQQLVDGSGLSLRQFNSNVWGTFGSLRNKILNLKTFFSFPSSSRSDDELKAGIADFYDKSSGIWLDVWGDDMHHGYYPHPSFSDHKAAQMLMIENSLRWACNSTAENLLVRTPSDISSSSNSFRFVDVGCGVGGSSRYIARKLQKELGADATILGQGISLSPVQVQRATELTAAANLSESLDFRVQDAMKMHTALLPEPSNGIYNLTWSMESGEHMPDKEAFVNELVRVTAPGGRIIVVTWCHRELDAAKGETALAPKELRLLKKINDAYFLPDWCAASRYVELMKSKGLLDVRSADWSEFVAPFWPAVLRSALRPKNLFRMLTAGSLATLKGAIAGLWMLRGFQKGLVKFSLITAQKPDE